jgi:hypothetical protein
MAAPFSEAAFHGGMMTGRSPALRCRMLGHIGVCAAGSTKAYATRSYQGEPHMNLHLTFGPLAALIAGILILVAPKLLNYIVAAYLIIVGILGLAGEGGFHFH